MQQGTGFSSNLTRIRKAKGISQTQLAQMTGISSRMLSHYEKHASKPPMDKVELIAKALNISITDLIETNEEYSFDREKIETLEHLSPKTLNQIKKLVKLNRDNRFAVYKMIDALLVQQEVEAKQKTPNA